MVPSEARSLASAVIGQGLVSQTRSLHRTYEAAGGLQSTTAPGRIRIITWALHRQLATHLIILE